MSLCADLPLHQAVKAGDIQATEAVLKADAAVEDSPGKCTTMHAHDCAQPHQQGHYSNIDLLVGSETPKQLNALSPPGSSDATTALSCAVTTGNIALVELLMAQEGIVPAKCNADGTTPLHAACSLEVASPPLVQ